MVSTADTDASTAGTVRAATVAIAVDNLSAVMPLVHGTEKTPVPSDSVLGCCAHAGDRCPDGQYPRRSSCNQRFERQVVSNRTSTARRDRTPLVSLRGISKAFGAVNALVDVSLDVYPGEVIALVGDNGAGKSTLVKVLAGDHQGDSGTILWNGAPVTISSPIDAQRLGIATVYQDLALCDNLDVVQNLFLGRESGSAFAMDEVDMEKQSWGLLQQLSVKIPSVRASVAGLSGGQRQSVAMARSILGNPSVVILDEPTAALGVEQTAEVLDLIERLSERGLGVLLISHNMPDVQSVSDRIEVLRLGTNNGSFLTREVSHEEIITAITGASENAVTDRAATHRAKKR